MARRRPKKDRGLSFRFRNGFLIAEMSSYGMDDVAFAIGGSRGTGRGSGMLGRVSDWSDVFEFIIREDVVDIMNELFENEGRGDVSWPPLSDNTVAAKRFFGHEEGILQRTGRLRESLTNVDDPDFYQEINARSASWGSSVTTEDGSRLLWELADEGTPPHRIEARNANALAFIVFNGAEPEWVFSFAVNHPGTEPRPLDVFFPSDVETWLNWCQQYAIAGYDNPDDRRPFKPATRR